MTPRRKRGSQDGHAHVDGRVRDGWVLPDQLNRLVVINNAPGHLDYQSAWARPEWFGIVAALLSLVLGYFFSKQFDAFFLVTQHPSRRQFLGAAVAASEARLNDLRRPRLGADGRQDGLDA